MALQAQVVYYQFLSERGSLCVLEIGYRPIKAELAISAYAVHSEHCLNQRQHLGLRKPLVVLVRVYAGIDRSGGPIREVITAEFPAILNGLAPKHYTIEATIPENYRAFEERPNLFSLCLQSGVSFKCEIWYEVCPSIVEGRIRVGSCEGIIGEVQLESRDGCQLCTRLESNGGFRFPDAYPGTWRLLVKQLVRESDGLPFHPEVLAMTETTIEVPPRRLAVPTIDIPDVPANEPSMVEVTLQDPAGQRLRGVRALVYDARGESLLATTVSDDEGNIIFQDPGTEWVLLRVKDSEQFERILLMQPTEG
jgi:hypothetical protein